MCEVSVNVWVCVKDRNGEKLRVVIFFGKGMRGGIWSKDNKMYNIFIGQAEHVVVNMMWATELSNAVTKWCSHYLCCIILRSFLEAERKSVCYFL